MNKDRLMTNGLYALLFVLPWQTVWIVTERALDGGGWEYGKTLLYATELLAIALVVLRGKPRLSETLTPLFRWAKLSALALLASAFVSADPLLALSHLFHVAAAAALALLIADERTDLSKVRRAFIAGLVPVSLFGIIQSFMGESPAAAWLGLSAHHAPELGASVVESAGGIRTLRAYGSFPHPNVFGGYLAVGILLCGWELAHKISLRTRWWLNYALVVFSATLVLTFSRSAWLAVAAGTGTIGILLLWSRRELPRRALPVAGIAGCAILLTLIVFRTEVLTRAIPTARLEERSIAERYAALAQFPEVFMSSPVFGTGASQFTSKLAELRPGFPSYAYQPVHNAFLLFLAESGLLASVFLLFAARELWRLLRPRLATRDGIMAASLIVCLLVLALFDHYLWSLWSGLALAGLVRGLSLDQSPKKE